MNQVYAVVLKLTIPVESVMVQVHPQTIIVLVTAQLSPTVLVHVVGLKLMMPVELVMEVLQMLLYVLVLAEHSWIVLEHVVELQ
jgi:hypothetical protein